MKNYQQGEDHLTLTAPAGGVVAGVPVKIGQLVLIPFADAAAGDPFVGQITGVFSGLPKHAGVAWTEGEILFWDNANSEFTPTSAAGLNQAGTAAAAAAAADTTGTVRLDGVARADV